jgi:hypothetical protein
MDCWHRELERAGTEAEVVRTASEYLALWSPRELAPITLGWREVNIDDASDIERVKRWLVEDLRSVAVPSGAGHLQELGDYLWHAAARIGEIRRGASTRTA